MVLNHSKRNEQIQDRLGGRLSASRRHRSGQPATTVTCTGPAPNSRTVLHCDLPALWTAIVQRIALECLLNPPSINFDLEPTPFQLTFKVEPEEAWRAVVLNRWRNVCPSCFDGEAERAGIRYRFVNVRAMPWSEMPEPARRYGRKRR